MNTNEVMNLDLVRMSLTASVMIVIILVLRKMTMNKLPKRTFHTLWLGVLFILLNPFTITSPISVESLWDLIIKNADTTQQYFMYEIDKESRLVNKSYPLGPHQWIWLTGVLVIAGYFTIQYRASVRIIQTALPLNNNPVLDQMLNKQSIKRQIKFFYSDQLFTPITCGLLKPKIIFPKNFDFNNEQKLNFVLTHEIVHIKRFDTLWKLLLLFALCLHWFNPFVWIMYRFAIRDIELSCDEHVLMKLGYSKRKEYALTLIQAIHPTSQLHSFYNAFNMHSTKERIESIMKYKKATLTTTLMGLAFAVGVTTVFATTAPSKDNSSKPSDSALVAQNTPKLIEENNIEASDKSKKQDQVDETNEALKNQEQETPMLQPDAEARVDADGTVTITNLRNGEEMVTTINAIRQQGGYYYLKDLNGHESGLKLKLDGDLLIFEK